MKKKPKTKNVVHEVAIFATISSGKSTLINALLGEDLLPNENQACTAKIFKVIDRDKIEKRLITAEYKNGEKKQISAEDLKILNTDENIKEIIIEQEFKVIKNIKKGKTTHKICLIDTPGTNNALDKKHGEITYKLIKEEKTTHIVYVLNATQLGINDDKKLLGDICDIRKSNNKDLKIIFVLNKADQIRSEKESIEEIITNTRQYLTNIGVESQNIIPISAYAAKIFKLALADKLKTYDDEIDFEFYYNWFSKNRILPVKQSILENDISVKIFGKEYKRSDILEKICATGIIELEKELERLMKDKISKHIKKEIKYYGKKMK